MIYQLSLRLVLATLVVATPILAQAAERGIALAIGNRAAVPALANSPNDAPALRSSTSRAQLDLYPFDGEWTGELQTTFSSAACGRKYRLEMSVTQGAATGSVARGGERFTLFGKISDDGKLTWTATGGRGSVTAEGVVDGDTARGDWEDDTGLCAGTFSIEKTS